MGGVGWFGSEIRENLFSGRKDFLECDLAGRACGAAGEIALSWGLVSEVEVSVRTFQELNLVVLGGIGTRMVSNGRDGEVE